MAVVMTPIYTQTVGAGGTGEVVFNNIPQIYTDLKIVISARFAHSAVAGTVNIGFNGGYTLITSRYAAGSGSVPSAGVSAASLIGDVSANNTTSNTFGTIDVHIPNYRSSNFKQYASESVSENNATEAYSEIWAGLFRSTSAITQVRFSGVAGLMQHSTFSLYGIIRSGD